MKIVITAGYDNSDYAIGLCEILKKSGHNIDTVIVVTPYSLKRLKFMLKQRGFDGLKKLINKLLPNRKAEGGLSLLRKFLIEKGITFSSLKKWCKANESKYILVDNLNSQKSINSIKHSNSDVVVYAGGGILKKAFIKEANYKIINNHSGPLPEIRGMNALEWSILLGYKPSCSIHFIDEGIDTGNLISIQEIPVAKDDNIETLREKVIIQGLMEIEKLFYGLKNINDLKEEQYKSNIEYRQCYIMAPALRQLVSKKF